MSSLIHEIEQSLLRRGPAQALFWQDRAWSFAELDVWSKRMAWGLRAQGITPGDRVATSLRNSPELVVAVLAILRCGAILVPLNPSATANELGHLLGDCRAALVLTQPEQVAAIRACGYAGPLLTAAALLDAASSRATEAPLPRRGPEAPAILMYTSGTTSRPKGVLLSQGALFANFSTVATIWEWTQADRLLLTLPCFHLHGLGLGILLSLCVGSSLVLCPGFVAEEALALLSRLECTMFFGVPTIYNRLVQLSDEALARVDLRRMRMWVSGSALMPASTYERFRQRFGYALMNRYGLTEACCVLSTRGTEVRRAGNVGRPLPGVEVRLVDPERLDRGEMIEVTDSEPGELLIRGPSLLSAYWNRPEELQRALASGFLRSGDLAVREPDGTFRILGRRSLDIIKSRGYKISAVELESCLQDHPAVAEVAVVGLPDPDRGEAVVAAVVLAAGASASEQELRDYATQHLSPHKVPAQFRFLEKIPCVGPGKFNKPELIKKLG